MNRDILSIKAKLRCSRGAKRIAILWPLVLYGLIQLAFNQLLHTNTPARHGYLQPTAPGPPFSHIQQQHSARGPLAQSFLQQAQPPPSSLSSSSCSSTIHTTKKSTSNAYTSVEFLFTSAYKSLLNMFEFSLGNMRASWRTVRPNIISAQAALLYQDNQSKGIIVLNSSNFNSELIQHKHPFPHVKLIEYYLSFCGVCSKFKATYTKLAREIYPWRNVIRPSAIDLGISNNSPIAHSWSVKIVPTLRIHPPPSASLAEKLNEMLLTWSPIMQPSDLHRAMFSEYNSSQLMIKSLNVSQYMDQVYLLKLDLLRYLEQYVRQTDASSLPSSWPNLRPVTETSLSELLQNHPRRELFLLIEAQSAISDSDQSSELGLRSSGLKALSVILELSSATPWRAIRYVRASENRALVEDVIIQLKRSNSERNSTAGSNNTNSNNDTIMNQYAEQAKLLNNILSDKPIIGNNNNQHNGDVLLIHVDYSHLQMVNGSPTKASPSVALITNTDLVNMEQSISVESQLTGTDNYSMGRTERAINQSEVKSKLQNMLKQDRSRSTRSLFDAKNSAATSNSMIDNLSSERKSELIVQYIKQVYTETSEDRLFVDAIDNLNDNSIKTDDTFEPPNKAFEKFIKTQLIMACIFCLILIFALRCITYYIERQRRHKATTLNGNGPLYSLTLHGNGVE